MAKASVREMMLQVREDAIVASVNRLLAEKGYDAMTVDEVAADVGIAKASLYKHFISKDALAAAAMVRVLELALAHIAALEADPRDADPAHAIEQLKSVVRWAMRAQLAGEMPSLPAQNSMLRSALMANKVYLDRLMEVSDKLGRWITTAQRQGAVSAALPPELVLYSLYTRACDPVLGLLKAGGRYGDDEIIELLMVTCFDGLAAR